MPCSQLPAIDPGNAFQRLASLCLRCTQPELLQTAVNNCSGSDICTLLLIDLNKDDDASQEVIFCCSEGCRADDLVLLTKAELGDEPGTASQPPEVHLLALIERVDIDEGNRSQKIVVGHVNLVSGSAGLHLTRLCVCLLCRLLAKR